MTYGTVNADLITTSDGVSSAGLYGLKNRLINGDMRIDQRNAGASVTPTTDGQYTLDRMQVYISAASKFSVQRDSTVYPTGFTNSAKITSLAATSLATGDYYCFVQSVEGFNIADLSYGTASAATVTLSFWVRSSLTGTFGGSVRALGSTTRSYPFTYSISAANTWEQKTVTIPGDTGFTPYTNNSAGYNVSFGLGVGTTYSGSASGSWSSNNYLSATGATSVVGTNGATFYITGVQLEKGSTATSFDYLDYGRSLIQCQRYYERQVWSTGAAAALLLNTGYTNGVANVFQTFKFAVEKRAAATTTKLGTWSVSNAGQPLVYGSDTFGCSLYFVSTGAASSPYALAAGSGQGFDATAEL